MALLPGNHTPSLYSKLTVHYRSDVAGQVLPWFGKDWTQNGVTELFNAITDNGYHIVYLSARAIGQVSATLSLALITSNMMYH